MRRFLLTAIVAILPLLASAQQVGPVNVEISTEKVIVDGKSFYMHNVQPGQTIYSICKAYGISSEELAASNPSLKDGLKAGSLILIPTAQEKSPEPELKWYQKIFRTKKEKKEKQEVVVVEPEDTANPDAVSVADNIQPEQTEDPGQTQAFRFDASRPARIALVLPLKAASGSPSNNALDFYSGALQALYKAESQQSLNVVLNVFDEAEIKASGNSVLAGNDLIVSTASLEHIRPLAEFAAENCIPLVSAMDSKVDTLLSDNPWLFQVPVSHDNQLRNLTRSLDPKTTDRVYLFSDSRYPGSAFTASITEYLAENGISNYTPVSYDILKGRELGIKLGKQWSKHYTYKIIVASEDPAFAPDVIRNLKMTGRYIPIQVFCSNKIRNFDSVDSDSFYLLSAHFSAPYFVDYSDPDTKDFVMKYRALFNTEPTAHSFQGFDILTYFLQVMQQEGSLFVSNISNHPQNLLQCNFHFVRSDEKSGWHNCATRDLVYSPEFSISVEKQD